jgi:hypothetical protein
MKFCVLNAHLPNYAALAALTTYANRTEYCQRHGYTLRVKTDGFVMKAAHPVSWDRLALMRAIVASGEYDWVYCCGTDTLHTNFNIRLEDRVDDGFHVVISPDWCAPVQADSFFVRKSELGLAYLDDLLSQYEKYRTHPWVENQAMIDLLPKWQHAVKILPQRMLNAYHYPLFQKIYPNVPQVAKALDFYGNDGQWQPGDFLIHWPSLDLAVRIAEIHRITPLIVK